MSNLTTRATKGDSLTHGELDTNFKRGAQTKAASYTVVEGDNRDAIDVTAVATITLPDATAIVAAADTGDFQVTLNNTTVAVMTITCVTGTDTIDGSTSDYIVNGIDSITLKVDQAGTGYNIVGGAATKTATETLTNKTLTSPTITSFVGGVITSGTVSTAPATATVDFTGIPSWVKRVTVLFDNLGMSANTGVLELQLGVTAGIDTTADYSWSYCNLTNAAAVAVADNQAFNRFRLVPAHGVSLDIFTGHVVIENITGNVWDISGAIGNIARQGVCTGRKALSDTLTQIRILNSSGNTFDTGSINIMYEG